MRIWFKMIDYILIIERVGFPIFVAGVLLYDKIKTNGSLIKVVENNNTILKDIRTRLK